MWPFAKTKMGKDGLAEESVEQAAEECLSACLPTDEEETSAQQQEEEIVDFPEEDTTGVIDLAVERVKQMKNVAAKTVSSAESLRDTLHPVKAKAGV